jgi:hypothetical protein
MDLMEKEHLKMKSVDRRMKIIQNFCVNIEVQASKSKEKKSEVLRELFEVQASKSEEKISEVLRELFEVQASKSEEKFSEVSCE